MMYSQYIVRFICQINTKYTYLKLRKTQINIMLVNYHIYFVDLI